MDTSEHHDATPGTPETATLSELLASMPDGMGQLNDKLGVEVIEAGVERVVGTMPVAGNTQPYGLLHGGASAALAESLGSMGAGLHAYPDSYAVGVDINATHHRSATSGTVTGVATPVHRGRASACYEVVVSDEQGRRVCTARLTCALLPAGDRAQ